MPSLSTILICIAALGSSLVEAGPRQARNLKLDNGNRIVDASIENLVNSRHVEKRDTDTNCNGSSECYIDMREDYCQNAFESIDLDKRYYTGASAEETGVCWSMCGIFVEGDDCDLSGKEMKAGTKEIWGSGCKACGQKIYEDGCILTINYVTGC